MDPAYRKEGAIIHGNYETQQTRLTDHPNPNEANPSPGAGLHPLAFLVACGWTVSWTSEVGKWTWLQVPIAAACLVYLGLVGLRLSVEEGHRIRKRLRASRSG